MLISLFNPNDLIGCGGDINQSESVGQVGLCGSLHGSMWVYVRGLFLRGGGEKSGFYVN